MLYNKMNWENNVQINQTWDDYVVAVYIFMGVYGWMLLFR